MSYKIDLIVHNIIVISFSFSVEFFFLNFGGVVIFIVDFLLPYKELYVHGFQD
jgi:hypothetical protein